MRLLIAIGMALLVAAISHAATTQAEFNSQGRGETFELCEGEDTAGTAVCATSDGASEYYALTDQHVQFLATFQESGTSGSSCDIRGLDQDQFNNAGASLSGDGFLIATISASLPPYEFEFPVFAVYAECTIVAGGTVDVNLTATRKGRQ